MDSSVQSFLGLESSLLSGLFGLVLRRPLIALGVRLLTEGELRLLRFPFACDRRVLALHGPL
jgi:hypothetical protein